MHPVIQLLIAVMITVITAVVWPPIIYWMGAFMLLLIVVKICRRSFRWVKNNKSNSRFLAVISFLIYVATFLVPAMLADYFLKPKLSAVTMVMCFALAYAAVAVIVTALDRFRR